MAQSDQTNIKNDQLKELWNAFQGMVDKAPAFGSVAMIVHMREGVPQRFETTRQESQFLQSAGGVK
jgi:hypothetical protein